MEKNSEKTLHFYCEGLGWRQTQVGRRARPEASRGHRPICAPDEAVVGPLGHCEGVSHIAHSEGRFRAQLG